MSTLRDDERARRHGMRRTTRAVYGHREIEPRLELATRVEQGACGATRGGPAHETKAERDASGDPRLSLEERYTDHKGYVDAVRSAAANAVAQGFLLQSSADALIAQAEDSNVLK